MKSTTLLFVLTISLLNSNGQKKPLDENALSGWEKIDNEKISSNGKYIMYTVTRAKSNSILELISTDSSWTMDIKGGVEGTFTNDSRLSVIKLSGDSMAIVTLGKNNIKYFAEVASFKTPQNNSDKWLAYKLKSSKNQLIIKNHFTGKEYSFNDVSNYQFADQGNALVLLASKENNNKNEFHLQMLDLNTNELKSIWKGTNPASEFTFDESGKKLAFFTSHNGNNNIYYYSAELNNSILYVSNQTQGMGANLNISNNPQLKFSPDGHKLYFYVSNKSTAKEDSEDSESSKVEIWSYNDDWLQSQQSQQLTFIQDRSFLSVINEQDKKVIRLENESDSWIIQPKLSDNGNGEFVLVRDARNENESYWRKSAQPNLYLVSTKDGNRRTVTECIRNIIFNTQFSPKGKFIIWYDFDRRNYYSFNVETSTIKNITQNILFPLYDEKHDRPHPPSEYGIAGWSKNDKFIYIYDRYDIWKVDPNGLKESVNITKGFGRKNNVILRCIDHQDKDILSFKIDNYFILAGFDEKTKFNGFYKLKNDNNGEPIKLTMGPYAYYFPNIYPSSFVSIFQVPTKAKERDIFLVKRMSSTECPNIFVTKDFINFVQISNIAPQKGYLWLKSELVKWKLPNGKDAEGVIYKPETFDSTKKYPVIFNLYERIADGVNKFIYPALSNGSLNIPYFVSNGFIVFCPDIYYEVGKPGESALKSVTSAVTSISKSPWIDTTQLGLYGHSFGGFEVNFIITKTNQFRAAGSAAGLSDMVSGYGSTRGSGESDQFMFERHQMRLGCSLWQNPNIYIENSPVFYADKINTPLLIMHNKNDNAVPWQHGLELFTSLRRLKKKVWMLQYNNGDHTLFQEKDCLDYTIRLKQFFNYFLTDSVAPYWISNTVVLKPKG